jgi:hypothetical protein
MFHIMITITSYGQKHSVFDFITDRIFEIQETAILIFSITMFWDVTSCSLGDGFLQNVRIVTYRTTRCHSPAGTILDIHWCENLKFTIILFKNNVSSSDYVVSM